MGKYSPAILVLIARLYMLLTILGDVGCLALGFAEGIQLSSG